MTGTEIVLIAVGGLVPVAGLAAGVLRRRRAADLPAVVARTAARRLGGRMDAATAGLYTPALLVELDGHLVRASSWPTHVPFDRKLRPPYFEIVTPVDGVQSSILVARTRSAEALATLDGGVRRRCGRASEGGLIVYGGQPAPWASAVFERFESWELLELDARMLRVVTSDPTHTPFDAAAAERAVRTFAAAVPFVLEAAGITSSSAQGGAA